MSAVQGVQTRLGKLENAVAELEMKYNAISAANSRVSRLEEAWKAAIGLWDKRMTSMERWNAEEFPQFKMDLGSLRLEMMALKAALNLDEKKAIETGKIFFKDGTTICSLDSEKFDAQLP